MTIRSRPRPPAAETLARPAREETTMPRGPRKPTVPPESADPGIYQTEEDRRWLAEYAAFYKALRENDPVAYEEWIDEVREWDFTLMDGLEDE